MTEWSQWLEDNWVYFCLGCCTSTKDQRNIMTLNKLCKKHNVSLKVVMEIINEYTEVIKND